MKRLTKRVAVAVSVVAALTAASCGSDGDDASSDSQGVGSSTTAAAAGDDGSDIDRDGTVRYVWSAVPSGNMDPHFGANVLVDFPPQALVYDRLLQINADRELQPLLATDWTLADDTTLVFTLREGVMFHDGTPFDSEAVVKSLERAKSAGSAHERTLANLVSVEASGPLEVTMRLGQPEPTFLYTLAGLAGAIVSPAALTSGQNLAVAPAGSGPYELAPDSAPPTLRYVRNDTYWDPEQALAARIELWGIGDANTRINALRSGQVDVIFTPPVDAALALQDDPNFEVFKPPVNAPQTLFLNTAVEPLDNPEVRRALNLAIDRASISEALFGGECAPAGQVFTEGFAGYDSALDDGYSYDLEEAKSILAAAGFSDGFTIDTLQGTGSFQEVIAEVLKEQLAQIGVTLNLEKIPSAQARPTWREGGYGAWVGAVSVLSPDPSAYINTVFLGPENPGEVVPDGLADAAAEASVQPLDSVERAEAFADVNRLIFESPVHVPICNLPIWYISNGKVANLDRLMGTSYTASVDIRYLAVTK